MFRKRITVLIWLVLGFVLLPVSWSGAQAVIHTSSLASVLTGASSLTPLSVSQDHPSSHISSNRSLPGFPDSKSGAVRPHGTRDLAVSLPPEIDQPVQPFLHKQYVQILTESFLQHSRIAISCPRAPPVLL